MTVFQWSSKYELGLAIIDEQHKVLVQLINDMEEVLAGKQTAQYSIVFADLIKYTRYHFTTEEALMLASGYDLDEINAHIKQHKQFIDELDIVCKDTSLITESELQIILSFLINWLTNHICKVDRRLVDHLEKDESFKHFNSLHERSKSQKIISQKEVDYKSLMGYFYRAIKTAEEEIRQALYAPVNANKQTHDLIIESALKKITLVRKAIGRLSLSK